MVSGKDKKSSEKEKTPVVAVRRRLTDTNNAGGLNVDRCIEQLRRCEILTESTVKDLCNKLKEILIDEPNVVPLHSPLTVVGDIQGQFFDLLEIFKIAGDCPDTNYLFLGNMTNRGFYSVETVSLLLCLKLRWPNRITILRGNHESKALTEIYGLYAECMRRYGNANVWKYFISVFDHLSLGATIDDKIFAVHAGLSPQINTLDQIRVLDRFHDIPKEGAITDLVWSDPDPERDGFNRTGRNAGCSFGQSIVQKFLQTNRIESIVRGHQLCMDGYQILFDHKISTVWSAPNYCYRCGNIAAVLEISENLDKYYNTFLPCPDSERQVPEVDWLKEMPDYFA
eukprot:TRINITY_DN4360_c0_g1_i4.p1 TRINITY_DN4360_c0_g1~~TRINITY_DN4360_c0_g1_i4.p1  ORF type:complete len:340 (+),score=82.84 TRINITY_DN4360_c0_g1_i4:93-1112(+)